jgi:RNA polymerase sigma-70 factor (ECF subfamily)
VPDAAEVFLRHAPRIYSLARRLLGNEADADDVVQDVLVQVVRNLDSFRGECHVTTWLHRVTVNAALLHRRKRAARAAREAYAALDRVADHGRPASAAQAGRHLPDRQAQARELRELVGRAIARLPKVYRDAAVLSGLEGLPNAQVGAALGLSLPAVKSRLHRARLLLRQALAPHLGEGPPA